MELHGGPWGFHGGSMEFHGDSMKLYGGPWNLHGTAWTSKVIMQGRCQFHNNQKKLMIPLIIKNITFSN